MSTLSWYILLACVICWNVISRCLSSMGYMILGVNYGVNKGGNGINEDSYEDSGGEDEIERDLDEDLDD